MADEHHVQREWDMVHSLQDVINSGCVSEFNPLLASLEDQVVTFDEDHGPAPSERRLLGAVVDRS
jgi:hypothetical protein